MVYGLEKVCRKHRLQNQYCSALLPLPTYHFLEFLHSDAPRVCPRFQIGKKFLRELKKYMYLTEDNFYLEN